MAIKLVSYLKANGEEFLGFLDEWYQDLPIVSLKSLLKDYPAAQTALISIDVINGLFEKNEDCHIVVPANCVDTFDIPVDRQKRGGYLASSGGIYARVVSVSHAHEWHSYRWSN